MVEKVVIEKIKAGEPVMVKEKSNDKGKYFVVRTAKTSEDKYHLFTISSGGSQDRRQSHGHFQIKSINNGFIVHDISSWWGSNHEVLLAIKDGGYAEIEGNHGAGFKDRGPQPDFLIQLQSSGEQKEISNMDLE